MKKYLIFAIGIFFVLISVSFVNAVQTVTVCASGCNFTSIQAAVDDSDVAHGDTINVSGSYTEAVNVTKALTIQTNDTNRSQYANVSGFSIDCQNTNITRFRITDDFPITDIIGRAAIEFADSCGQVGDINILDNYIENHSIGIYINLANATIANNSIKNSTYAIYHHNGQGNISNNTITNNTWGFWSTTPQYNMNVSKNNFSNSTRFGYWTTSSEPYNLVYDNIFTNMDRCILIRNGNAIVQGNICENVTFGIVLQAFGGWTGTTIVFNNTIENATDTGIKVNRSDSWITRTNITNNTLINNSVAFNISTDYVDLNVTGNSIFNNTNGLYINLTSGGTNYIYDNNFTDNVNFNAKGGNDTTIFWNRTKVAGTNIIGGSYFGGNYWDTYTGQDTDGDGLGDTETPFTDYNNITTGGDELPLVSPTVNNPPSINSNYTTPNLTALNLTFGNDMFITANVTPNDAGDTLYFVNFTITAPNGTAMLDNENGTNCDGTTAYYCNQTTKVDVDANGTWSVAIEARDNGTATTKWNNWTFNILDSVNISPTAISVSLVKGQNKTITLNLTSNTNETIAFNLGDNHTMNHANFTTGFIPTPLLVNNLTNTTTYWIYVNSTAEFRTNYLALYYNRTDGGKDQNIIVTVTVANSAGDLNWSNGTSVWNTTVEESKGACNVWLINNTGNATANFTNFTMTAPTGQNSSASFATFNITSLNLTNDSDARTYQVRLCLWPTVGDAGTYKENYIYPTYVTGGGIVNESNIQEPLINITVTEHTTPGETTPGGPTPPISVTLPPPPSISVCGDGTCDEDENTINCPVDCKAKISKSRLIQALVLLIIAGFIYSMYKDRIEQKRREFRRRMIRLRRRY